MKKYFALILLLAFFSCKKDNQILDDENGPKILSISFKKEYNPTLFKDVNLQLEASDFTSDIEFLPNYLIATFEFEGDDVTVNGRSQISSQSQNMFLTPVKYTVSKQGYADKHYNISLNYTRNVPVIEILTQNSVGITSKEDYVACDIIQRNGGESFENFQASGKIRGRGNSTWFLHPKKPYQLKFDDEQSMLNMPSEKKWIFLAEHSDKTLLRNTLAFEMGAVSSLDYTPQGVFAEVYLNKEYIGVYNICQKVEEGATRVDLKGVGYLLEIDQLDRIDAGDTYFQTSNYYINIKDPDVAYGSDQYTVVKDHINLFENTLMGDNFMNENSGYRSFVDIYSFADWFLINEILRNPDAKSWSSIFLTYVPGEKIKMGPLWDFDLSLGNANYDGHENPEGFWVMENTWIKRMYQDPYFRNIVRERFEFFKENQAYFIDVIDSNFNYLSNAHSRNNQKWNVLGNWVWPNVKVFDTYNEEVNYLRTYFKTRMKWLDNNLQ